LFIQSTFTFRLNRKCENRSFRNHKTTRPRNINENKKKEGGLFPQLLAGKQPNDYHDCGNHKQYMYQRAYARQSEEPNQPE
jgi:hypothetical protein